MAVLVKICGINSVEAADAAAKARADFAGMIFHRTSPRYLDPIRAGIVAERLRGRLRTVALLIDPNDEEIAGVVTVVKPDFLQLHGNETPARVGAIKSRFGVPTIKAFAIADANDFASVAAYNDAADMFLFDVLMAGGAPTYSQSFPERRKLLESILTPNDHVGLAEQRVVSSVEEATAFLDEAIAAGGEGVMAKSVKEGSAYRAGARGYWWIKYKRDYTVGLADSIDGVVVGAFQGRGRRAGRYGAFLLAVYNPKRDRFETFCKVGSGFDDAALAEMPKRLARFESDTQPPEVETGIIPDRWMRPGLVLEVRGAELTVSPIHRAELGAVRAGAGLALRFPRFTGRIRDDKGPTEATTAQELLEMYRLQVRQEASPDAKPSDDPA